MAKTIRFGPYTVDPDHPVLRKHDVRIKLQRQPYRLLLLLIRHKGDVVDRETMIRELWGDGTQVDFERGLNFCISQIRTALNDDPAAPKYIETVRCEGYRFVGEVELRETEVASRPPESAPAALPPTEEVRTGEVPAGEVATEEPAVAWPSRRRFAVWGASGVAGAG